MRAPVRTVSCLLGLLLGCKTTERPGALDDVPAIDGGAREASVVDRPAQEAADDASDDATVRDASGDATTDGAANDGAAGDGATSDGATSDGATSDGAAGDGAAGDATADAACTSAQTRCGGACVDLRTSAEHCGRCGNACCPGNVCSAGACTVGCSAGQTPCPGPLSSCMGSVCVDTRNSVNNCGACGRACAPGQVCLSGACTADTPFMPFDPCTTIASYTTGNMVHFYDTLRYEPACLRVAHGSEVDFLGEFSTHPITPSSARGTRPNPIPATSTGTAIRVRFDTPGYYPFYCMFHGTDVGTGMAGVVWVE